MTQCKTVLWVQGMLRPDGEEQFKKYQEGVGPMFGEFQAQAVTFGNPVEGGNESFHINAAVAFPEKAQPDAFFGDPRYAALKTNHRDHAYAHLRLTGFHVTTPIRREEPGVVVGVLMREVGHGDEAAGRAEARGGVCLVAGTGFAADYLHDCFAHGALYQFEDAATAAAYAAEAAALDPEARVSCYQRIA